VNPVCLNGRGQFHVIIDDQGYTSRPAKPLQGGGLFDTLFGPNATTAWDITGENAGTVADFSFQQFEYLEGGSVADTFTFSSSGTITGYISGGGGTNTLVGSDQVDEFQLKVVDLVGAARPSIADPFIPQKIREGRDDEIRECIGCNICYTGDQTGTPIRCTQNPAIGEEWRKGWHPEHIPPKGSDSSVLIVGGGPSGLEAAVALGRRGYSVTLAEARRKLGGRVTLESELPGLRQWDRVRDWRLNQISKLSNVDYYLESVVDREQILEFEADRVVVATGAKWRRDGTGRSHEQEIQGWRAPSVMTPDEILGGVVPDGPVVVYDDDHYYIGGVIAEKLRGDGLEVTLITPANEVSTWTHHTVEQERIQTRILSLGIDLITGTSLSEIQSGGVIAECNYTGRTKEIPAATVVLATSREPQDDLYYSLRDDIDIERIGDCLAPGTIATAVYSGHRYAREMDVVVPEGVPFLRER